MKRAGQRLGSAQAHVEARSNTQYPLTLRDAPQHPWRFPPRGSDATPYLPPLARAS